MFYDSKAVTRLLSRWDYSPKAVEAYGRAMEAAWKNADARKLLAGTIEAYESGAEIDIKNVLKGMDTFAPECGESPYTMRMLPYLCLLEPAEARYRASGIAETVYNDSFADLLWKTRECHRIYGIWGSFVTPWFYRFFELKCFALGRLQFEFASFKADAPLEYGTRVINVHIPSSGPINMDECDSSYAKAVDFFGFKAENSVPFVCDSWMLHPFCSELNPDSGIRRFAACYDLLYSIDDPGYSDMWIIFGKPWDGRISDLPENTALQRVFKRHLLAGDSVGRGYGLYLRKV